MSIKKIISITSALLILGACSVDQEELEEVAERIANRVAKKIQEALQRKVKEAKKD